jgi:hypothetical protein
MRVSSTTVISAWRKPRLAANTARNPQAAMISTGPHDGQIAPMLGHGLGHPLRGPPLTQFVDRRDSLGARQRRSLVHDLCCVSPGFCLQVVSQGKTPERVPASVCSRRLGTYEATWEHVATSGTLEVVATLWRSSEDRRDAAVYRRYPTPQLTSARLSYSGFPP